MIQLEPIQNDSYLLTHYLKKDDLYKAFALQESNLSYVDTIHHNWYLGIEDNIAVGLFMFNYFSSNTMEFHGGVYKEYRGQDTPKKLKECLEAIRPHLNCKFITKHPAKNRLATLTVLRAGFKQIAKIKDGCKDQNNTCDLLIFSEVQNG